MNKYIHSFTMKLANNGQIIKANSYIMKMAINKMDVQSYLEKMKEIQNYIIKYLDYGNNNQEETDNFIELINDFQIQEDKNEFKSFLRVLLNLSNEHRRYSGFFDKIFQILQFFIPQLTDCFTNKEIFNIFKENKRILLFLIEEQILRFNKYVASEIVRLKYYYYFYPEIKQINFYINDKKATEYEENLNDKFEENRRIGENNNNLCNLIRNDIIKEFIIYVNQTNLPIKTYRIQHSIFETNNFLINKKPTLIEYSAFFGSIQIFRYLHMNSVELTSSIWLYVIHGSNPQMIHFLEENHIEPYESFETCFIEAIKCHHNEIAQYLLDNFITKNDLFLEKLVFDSVKYYNFEFIQTDHLNQDRFNDLCENNNSYLVNLLISNGIVDINKKKIIICIINYTIQTLIN